MKEYNIYQADQFTPEVIIATYNDKEEAELELSKIQKESIKHDMFTCFYIKEEFLK